MLKPLLLSFLLLITGLTAFSNDYQKAWEALRKNDRKQAAQYLEKAMGDPATSVDASITYLYLQLFGGNEKTDDLFTQKIWKSVKDVNPYLYAMWFNEYVLGDYGRKTKAHQLSLLQDIFSKAEVNGSLKSAAHYVKGMHWLSSNEFEKAAEEWKQIGSLDNWQLVGPFENLSGSGFYKSFGPLEQSSASAEFKSLNNANVKWFRPTSTNQDGWMFIQSHIPNNTAVTYAQTFVFAPSDMKVLLNAGVNGSIKVWVNDALIISESEERVTELDCYKNYCQLKKGFNRVLVQLGYTDNSIPNFIVRLTDATGNAIGGLRTEPVAQSYTKATAPAPTASLPHFAEAFFEEKIKAEPGNFVNYILLTQTYLRNKKTFQARKTIEAALAQDPDNSLLRYELVQCLLKNGSRTLLSQQIEWFKEKDPHCYLAYQLNVDRLIDEEKYDEALSLVSEMATAYGNNEDAINTKIRILGAQEKMDEAVKEIQAAYEKYPDNISFTGMMFRLKKNAYKDNEGAIEVYKKYLGPNFNYGIFKGLAEEYIDLGQKEKGLAMMERLVKLFPYDADYMAQMTRYYYQQQDYSKALEYCDLSLGLAPYVSNYWDNKAIIQSQKGEDQLAAENYRKALYYDSKRYESRQKLRAIEKKEDLYKYFPQTDLYEVIRKAAEKPIAQDYAYSYLLDEKMVVVHTEGAREEFSTMILRINTEKGIDQWKESYIPYNEYTQTLLIEKAEVVKKNGTKSTAETEGNQIVFTSLEAGDAVIIKYRLQDFARGRLAREFWDRYVFSAFNPSELARYCLLVDKNVKYNYTFENTDIKPEIKDLGDYSLYTWQMTNLEPVKDEPYMPTLTDVGATLHLSTMRSWNDVAQWYSDISYAKTDDEYELKEVYRELFPGTEKLTDLQKARRIYDYIEKNIRYSSVSFRQSAYVPQKASVTLNTRLGDCKDLSSLFVSLGAMAGLKSNLVLVDTRDNGTKEMMLPSVEFNHCIVLLKADGKEYYLELTDNDLPFGSLPSNLPGAQSLIIPGHTETFVSNIQALPGLNRTSDQTRRVIHISTDGNDLKLKVDIKRKGALTSSVRNSYADLSDEKIKEKLEESISGSFKNPVKVETVSFGDLSSLTDSVAYGYTATVKDDVIEVGDMQMFKVPFGDIIATLDNFSKDTRKFPLEYWRYEEADEYETIVTIALPAGKKLVEMPARQQYTFNKSSYSISYGMSANNVLTITRKASLKRNDIAPADYPAFKEFVNKIVKIESKYIAFK